MTKRGALLVALVLPFLWGATRSWAGENAVCCICSGCGNQNSTSTGAAAGVCLSAEDGEECSDACAMSGCSDVNIAKVACDAPQLATLCSARSAPAASPLGIASLAVLLASGGAFVLSRRRA